MTPISAAQVKELHKELITKDEIVEIGLSLANGKMNDSQLNDLIIAKAS